MDLHTALITVIAVCAVFSFLFVGFNALLSAKIKPIEENLAGLKKNQASLKENQERFESELREIKSKLDQLLAQRA